MRKLIAINAVQLAVNGVLAEIPAGSGFMVDDEMAINHLFNAEAVREPTEKELKILFDADAVVPLPVADGKPVGVADISKLTKAELIEHGATKGLTLDESSTKAEMVAAIEAHESDEL